MALRKRAGKTSLARLEPLRKRVRRADILRDTWEAIARKRNAETLLCTETQMNIVTAPAGQSAATAKKQDGQSRTDTDAPCQKCGDERAKRKQCDRVLADSKAIIAGCTDTTSTTKHVSSEVCNAEDEKSKAENKGPAPMHEYTCPFCHQRCQSVVHTGKIDHRNHCGKQFMVHNGIVAGRTHQHLCPKCGTVVHASKPTGRIQVKHRNGNGRRCPCECWHVPTA